VSPGFAGRQVPGDRCHRRAGLCRPAGGVVKAGSRRNHFPIAAKPSGNDHQLALASIKQRGTIMWAFIISLIYDHSCKKYLADVGRHQHRWI
jgi:hypothetical protein